MLIALFTDVHNPIFYPAYLHLFRVRCLQCYVIIVQLHSLLRLGLAYPKLIFKPTTK